MEQKQPASSLSKATAAVLGVSVTVCGVLFWTLITGYGQDIAELQQQQRLEQIHIRENYVHKNEYHRDIDEIKEILKDISDKIITGKED